MKKNILFVILILMSAKAFSQENMITIGGGYSSVNIEDTDTRATGWRITGLYEFNPAGSILAHGFSFGYVSVSASETAGQQEIKSTINSFPVYYAPKLMFGKEKIKIFLKGALGMQFATLKREGAVSLTDKDFGFYGGGGAGLMLFLKDNIFINAEYEIAWASNNCYKDGWISTIGGGIGFKF